MIKGSILVLAALVAAFAACRSPLDIDTIRNVKGVNIDSVANTLVNGIKDTVIATVDKRQINFAYQVERFRPHDGIVDGAYYITASATSSDPNGPDYTRISLRLDAIRDTGVYQMNAYYSKPKGIDSAAPPEYSALLERHQFGYTTFYRTADTGARGEIHVLVIDRVRKVIAGTFHFVGHSVEDIAVVEVQDGAFRFDLDP